MYTLTGSRLLLPFTHVPHVCTHCLYAADFSLADLKAAGMSPADLKAADFSLADLNEAGSSATDLNAAGFSLADLIDDVSARQI